MEHGAAPLRLPGWARRPRWLPALGWRPSRGAAILGIAGLIVGLAAGYALGYRHLGQAVPPSRATPAGTVLPAIAGSAAPPGLAASADGPGAYSSSLSIAGLPGLAQTGGECAVQRGRDLQLGVEVINLSSTAVTLGQVRSILPMGGLRADLAAVGAVRHDLVLLAGNRRRLVRLRQRVDGRGRDGKLARPPAVRHRLAQRHLPGASGVSGPAAGAVQRQLPGERPNGHHAAARIPGPGARHVHRMQVALTRARRAPPSEDQNRFARTVPCFAFTV